MMIRSGRCRSAAARSSLGVTAAWPGIASTASQRIACGWRTCSLRRLLNDQKPVIQWKMIQEGFHQRCLAATGAAADHSVALLVNEFHNLIANALGSVPLSISSSVVYQRLNFRMVSVTPLIAAGGPTTATREPSGNRVFRIGF